MWGTNADALANASMDHYARIAQGDLWMPGKTVLVLECVRLDIGFRYIQGVRCCPNVGRWARNRTTDSGYCEPTLNNGANVTVIGRRVGVRATGYGFCIMESDS